jgi:hypothetical protein
MRRGAEGFARDPVATAQPVRKHRASRTYSSTHSRRGALQCKAATNANRGGIQVAVVAFR